MRHTQLQQSMSCINRFGALAGLVKKIKRTGWTRYLPTEKVESVGDHSAKIAFLTLYLRNIENLDYLKCLQMALIHDIAEGLVGDYTPYCKITPEQKFQKQHTAMKQIFKQLGQQNQTYYETLWLEYEKGETFEAKIVKDLDKLEMIQQAFEYEKQHQVNLSQFYECIAKMKTPLVKKWAEQLLTTRNQHTKNKTN